MKADVAHDLAAGWRVRTDGDELGAVRVRGDAGFRGEPGSAVPSAQIRADLDDIVEARPAVLRTPVAQSEKLLAV